MDLNKNIDPERTGKFIKILRKSHNMTQEQLGAKLFITRKAVSKWETGRACPSIDMLKKLSETLGTSVEDIIEGDFEKLEALLKKKNNVVYKTVHSEVFKKGGHFAKIFVIFVLVIFFITNFNATKVYTISYEDDTFSIDNGMIVFSNIRSYISLGTFYSNEDGVDKDNSYKFELYLNGENGETFILECDSDKMVDIPRSVSRVLKKSLSKKNEKLILKLTRLDNNKVFDLELTVLEKDDLELSKSRNEIFNNSVFGHYSSNVLMENVGNKMYLVRGNIGYDSVPEYIDLNFLYRKTVDEIKNIYDNKFIEIFEDKYLIMFNKENLALIVYNANKKIEFRFGIPSIKINGGLFYYLLGDKTVCFNHSEFDSENYKFLNNVVMKLEEL